MPIYQYHCASCGADLEIFQHMTDPTLEVCPKCKGKLKKVFSPVGIVFKGSGFYATDSKKSSSATSSSSTATSPQASGPSSQTSSAPPAAPASSGASDSPASSGTSDSAAPPSPASS